MQDSLLPRFLRILFPYKIELKTLRQIYEDEKQLADIPCKANTPYIYILSIAKTYVMRKSLVLQRKHTSRSRFLDEGLIAPLLRFRSFHTLVSQYPCYFYSQGPRQRRDVNRLVDRSTFSPIILAEKSTRE